MSEREPNPGEKPFPEGSVAPVSYMRRIKRVVVAVIGFTVLVIGFFGIVLPLVPAFILVPAGLAILATEFVWARRWVKRAKSMFQRNRTVAPPEADREGSPKEKGPGAGTDRLP